MWPNPWQGDYWRACVNAFPNLGVVVLKSPMALCVPDEELNWIQEWSASTNLQHIYINHGFDEYLDIGSIDLIGVRTVFSRERGKWSDMAWRNSVPPFGRHHYIRSMKEEDKDTFDSEEELEDINYDIGWN